MNNTAPLYIQTARSRYAPCRGARVFGTASPHHAYLIANRRGTRMRMLIHDGQGIWLACRRLHQGRFRWAEGNGSLTLSQAQFDALVLGLPWQQLSGDGAIRMI